MHDWKLPLSYVILFSPTIQHSFMMLKYFILTNNTCFKVLFIRWWDDDPIKRATRNFFIKTSLTQVLLKLHESEQTPGDSEGQGSPESLGLQKVRHDLLTEGQ